MTESFLLEAAALLRARNEIDAKLASLVDRPITSGHLGEWIAAEIFDIELEASAAAEAIDGRFRSGALAGKTVNIKWYLKRENVLDMTSSELLDYYLVLSGPTSTVNTSRGGARPWVIENVYLFDARALSEELVRRGVKVGVAASVRAAQWQAAEVYPIQSNPHLPVSERQAELLREFSQKARRAGHPSS
jgi:hypothetical protein